MALVTYKYMVERMPLDELRRTFAARQHTLDYLVLELRRQADAKSLKSYFLYGPRGAGKTTLLRMVAWHLEEDADLRAAWLPVVFPEETHGVVSLRDLLAAVLRILGEHGNPKAQEWHARVERESDDPSSLALAVQGLREIVRSERRRLVVFVENLDALFADGKAQGLDRQERAALRNLLMAPDPWLMLVGTGVVSFPAIERYDEALFQYFQPVRIDRLDDEQVRQLLFRRAAFDGLADFETRYRMNQGKIRSLTRLTGGNPRLILMLYETIAVGAVTSIMQALLSLVDTLTPLLKDVIEHQMTRQQAKVLDALMRAGGTAQPRDLVVPTRLTLNAVNTQLTRLKEMQLLEVHGGGKGRPAYYSVPDRLFSTWYQIRYLRPNRRRIELFVEFLRIWFEEDARCEYLRQLAKAMPMSVKESPVSDNAYAPLALECVAASLKGTPYAQEAEEVVIRQWLTAGKLDQAAYALAEFAGLDDGDKRRYEVGAYGRLGAWSLDHDDLPHAIQAAQEAVGRDPNDFKALWTLGAAFMLSGQYAPAIEHFGRFLIVPLLPAVLRGGAFFFRGMAKRELGLIKEAVAEFTAAIEISGLPQVVLKNALVQRGITNGSQNNNNPAIADFTAIIKLPGITTDELAKALVLRGVAADQKGDTSGAIVDFTAAIELPNAPTDEVSLALIYRAEAKQKHGDFQGAIADCTAAIELPGVQVDQVAVALLYRGIDRGELGDLKGRIADCTVAAELQGAMPGTVAKAILYRGMAKGRQGDEEGALLDLRTAVLSPAIEEERRYIAVNVLLLSAVQSTDVADGIAFARQVADSLSPAAKVRYVIGLIHELKDPRMRPHWPRICRALCENQPPEVAEKLNFLLPVCEALETNDRSRLDPLPPEQRDFALEVLDGFETPAGGHTDTKAMKGG